jgi:DnaJ domain
LVIRSFVMRSRRAALDGLSKILDAAAPEDLFTGAEDEAQFLYDLLIDSARARSSAHYWEICRTARRRGVTPEYVVDRAVVLLGAINERRRTDLYRILGVPPLASDEAIRQRWLEIAKQHHPDVGGDADSFRTAKQAYEILRDPVRRGEYERFWLRALGPFERVAAHDESQQLEAMRAGVKSVPRVGAPARPVAPPVRPVSTIRPRPAPAPEAEPESAGGRAREDLRRMLAAAASLLAAREQLDGRLGASVVEGRAGLTDLLARLDVALAPVTSDELGALAGDVAGLVEDLERISADLRLVAELRTRLVPLSE